MQQTQLQITLYERQHRNELLNLTYYSQWTHKHLDWYKTGQWIDSEQGITYLAWQDDKLVGYIAMSLPLHGASWVRLLGIRDGCVPRPIIEQLWQTAEAHCLRLGVNRFAVLMVTNWLAAYIGGLGFDYLEDIVTLHRTSRILPAEPVSPVKVYSANPEDLSLITRVDHLAFRPPWQMTYRDLWQAYRISASATVAILDEEIVGYQISTRNRAVGHLARLAVMPNRQGKRIGSILLYELLSKLDRRGIKTVTVNTQTSNESSHRLYSHYGFHHNGFDLAVWQKDVTL
jgi:[ribosomal protein S18]-alanine N-acetyltransferase